MKRSTKIMMIIATSLCGAAVVLMITGIFLMGGDQMWKSKYETKTYTVEEKFSNISVHSITADVEIVFTDDGSCKVECDETTRLGYDVHVSEDTLMVEVADTRKWYDHISILDLDEKKLTLYVPEEEYGSVFVDNTTGDVKLPLGVVAKTLNVETTTGDVNISSATALQGISISASTGDISLSNTAAGRVSISVTTGGVNVSDVDASDIGISSTTGVVNIYKVWCNNLDIDISTGGVELDEVVALGRFDIESTTGDVTVEYSDAASVDINTTTGDIYASFITEKVVFADTTTGDIDVPYLTSGEPCNLKTTTGDITVEIKALKEDK